MSSSSINKTSKVVSFAVLVSFGVMSLSSVCASAYAETASTQSGVAASVSTLSSQINLFHMQIVAATTSSTPSKSAASHESLLGSIARSIGSAVGHIASGIGHVVSGVASGIIHVANGVIRGVGKVAAGVGTIVGGVAAGIGGAVGGVAAGVGSLIGGVAGGIGHTIFKAVQSIPSVTFHIPAIIAGAVLGGVHGFVSQFLPTSSADFNGLIPPIIRNAQAGITFFSTLFGAIGTVIPVVGNIVGTVAGTIVGAVIGAGLPLIAAPIAGAVHGALTAIGSAIMNSHHSGFQNAVVTPSTLAVIPAKTETQKPATSAVTAPSVALLG